MSSPVSTSTHASIAAVQRRQHLLGLGLAITGAVLFSAKAILAKLIYRYQVDAITVIALRMLFTVPLMAAIALWQVYRHPPLTKADRWRLVGLGLVGYYLSSFLDFLGLQYISAGLERLILFLTPSFVLFIHAFFMKKPILAKQWWSLAVAYLGIVLVFVHDLGFNGTQVIVGSGLVLGSAIAYATYLIQSGEMVQRLGSIRLVSYAMCVSSAASLLQFFILKPIDQLFQPEAVMGLSMLNAIFCTVLPVFLTMFAVKRVGAAIASQAGMIGPVSTLILGSVFLQEQVSVWQIAGAGLVISGMYLLSKLK